MTYCKNQVQFDPLPRALALFILCLAEVSRWSSWNFSLFNKLSLAEQNELVSCCYWNTGPILGSSYVLDAPGGTTSHVRSNILNLGDRLERVHQQALGQYLPLKMKGQRTAFSIVFRTRHQFHFDGMSEMDDGGDMNEDLASTMTCGSQHMNRSAVYLSQTRVVPIHWPTTSSDCGSRHLFRLRSTRPRWKYQELNRKAF